MKTDPSIKKGRFSMKYCSGCGTPCDDNAVHCPSCGKPFAPEAAPAVDPRDHTAEFDPKDISDNKVVAMLPYLLGVFGLIIALLMSNNSPYLRFHIRTALKFTVVEAILSICTVFLFWTILVPIAAGVCMIICTVLRIIAFFQICNGKAKDPAIISGLGFLK